MRNARILLLLFICVLSSLVFSFVNSGPVIAQSADSGFVWQDRSTIVRAGTNSYKLTDSKIDYNHTYKGTNDKGCEYEIHVDSGGLEGLTEPIDNPGRHVGEGELTYEPYDDRTGRCGDKKTERVNIGSPANFNISFYYKNRDTISRTDGAIRFTRAIDNGAPRAFNGQAVYLRPDEAGDKCQDFLLADEFAASGDNVPGYYEELDGNSNEGSRGSPGGGAVRERSDHPYIQSANVTCYIDKDGDQKREKNGDIAIRGWTTVAQVPAGTQGDTPGDSAGSDACEGSGVFGWILCPIVGLLGSVVDSLKDWFVSPFLQIDPLLTNQSADTPEGAVYNAWKGMRNLANILLVIVFLVIIFSQATSVGLDAYSIRKMLPRLVIAVIAVQISFFISAAMIDITNVLGAGVKSLIQAPFGSLSGFSFSEGFAGQAVALSGAIGGTVAVGAGLVAIAPLLTAAVMTLVVVIVVLSMRILLIYLLVLVSPIAFVLMVLPNTESLFRSWWSFFFRALLMYPMIEALFAISAILGALASQIASR